MKFLNIGPGELFMVLVLALLVFGPQRLPEIARKIGQGVRDLRNMVHSLDPELLEDWREITRDLDTVRDEMRNIRSDVVELQRDLTGAAKEVAASVDEAAKEAVSTVDQGIRGPGTAAKAATATGTSTARPQPATATAATGGSGTAATATASSLSASKPATGPAKPTTPSRPLPATSRAASTAKHASTARTAAQTSDEEIMGTLLTRDDDGNWHSLNEVVGVKVFPMRRPAPRPADGDGRHQPDLITTSREAQMARLTSARPARARAHRMGETPRPNPRPRPPVPVRPGRLERG